MQKVNGTRVTEDNHEPNEAEGIKAIRTIQAANGFDVTVEEATAMWRRITPEEKRHTMMVYRLVAVEPDVTTLN